MKKRLEIAAGARVRTLLLHFFFLEKAIASASDQKNWTTWFNLTPEVLPVGGIELGLSRGGHVCELLCANDPVAVAVLLPVSPLSVMTVS